MAYNVVGNLGNTVNTTRCAFAAYKSGSSANVTGDNTAYTILFDTKRFDQNTNYTTGTGTFTAPVTGIYYLCAICQLQNIGAGHNSALLSIIKGGGSFSNTTINPTAIKDVNNTATLMTSAVVTMNASDTITVQVTVFSSTKTITVAGASNDETAFYGYLIC